MLPPSQAVTPKESYSRQPDSDVAGPNSNARFCGLNSACYCITRVLVLGALAFAGTPARLLGQAAITLEGRVVSVHAGPLANVQVTAQGVSTGERRVVTTGVMGVFRILGLSPGRYHVATSILGFKPLAHTVELVIGQRGQITFTLEPTVLELTPLEVTAERAPSVEIQRMSVSTPILEQEIKQLPLNARNVMDLTALAPGIKAFKQATGRAVSGPTGRALPIVGALRGERFLNFYIDGLELKSLYNSGIAGFPELGSPLPVGALKEFRVYLNPYDVEYAGAAAYLITAVTQRGTNEAEGDVFGFFQNGSLVASTDFLRSIPNSDRTEFQRQQFGFNVRGPVRENRLFYAASYELMNKRDLIAVIPGKPVIDPGYWDQYAGTFAAPDRNHTGVVRLTYTPSDESAFDATWTARHQSNEGLFGGDLSHDAAAVSRRTVHTVGLRHRWLLTPRFLNELSLQFLGASETGGALFSGPHLRYQTLQIGRPESTFDLDEKHLRLINRMTRTVDGFHGSHLLKAGVEVARVSAAHLFPIFSNGSFRFANETDSLPNLAIIGVGFFNPESNRDALAKLDGWVTGLYLGDEWRPTPSLTLNFGLRYDAEINTLNNDFTVPWAADPEIGERPELQPFLNRGNRKNDLDNVSPRFSFSWNVADNGRTFVRGGFGIIYDRHFGFIGFSERRHASWRTYAFINPGTADVDVLRQRVLSGAVATPPSFEVLSLDMEAPANRQWSVGLGQQITPALSLNIDFIHQDIRNLPALVNLNWLDQSQSQARRVFSPNYGEIRVWDDFARARNRALLAQLSYQPNTVSRLTLAYTLGDAKADWDVANQSVPAGAAGQFYTMQRTSGDERHRAVLSGVVSLPFDFMLSTITTLASPRPYKAQVGQDLNANDFFEDDWIDGKRYVEPANRWRNWYRVIDLRFAKTFHFAGAKRGEIMADAYNLLNTENYASYYNQQTDRSGQANPSFGHPNDIFATRELQIGARVHF